MAGTLSGNNSNTAAAPFLNTHFVNVSNDSNQLQLCGNLPAEFHADPVNYLENIHASTYSLLPNKHDRDAEAIPRQQNLRVSVNNNKFNNETNIKAGLLGPNPVYTGLRLSYDDDERNSSLTSASGSLTPSVFSSLSNEIIQELDQQKEEFDHFIRSQEENMLRGVRDIKQRQTAVLLKNLEKTVLTKLHEKDLELETVTSKNKQLVESMKHLTAEAQNWGYMAKYNESVVNVLKTTLQQAMQSSNRGKEAQGESDVDDAASCIDPNNYLSSFARRSWRCKLNMICRLCKSKEASVLVMPCRHLCLCKACKSFVSACPVCQKLITTSFEVYLS